ncbi:hypothetical protein B0H66DRAFT_156499 [Apodospora peruviana]|uniref:Secreted protein n=1 Tax=Apodospora peruviana TaxID=516989 RepID=A0AAE0IKC4_9PEZI|nr:hypothetical protein B0H66DRAFT_156499 [Apodospora peruviana]
MPQTRSLLTHAFLASFPLGCFSDVGAERGKRETTSSCAFCRPFQTFQVTVHVYFDRPFPLLESRFDSLSLFLLRLIVIPPPLGEHSSVTAKALLKAVTVNFFCQCISHYRRGIFLDRTPSICFLPRYAEPTTSSSSPPLTFSSTPCVRTIPPDLKGNLFPRAENENNYMSKNWLSVTVP